MRFRRWLAPLAAVALLAAAAGCDVPPEGPPPDGGGATDPPFTVVVLPDTQYYAAYYPDIFDAQTAWIVANKTALNIAFVLHEGDIVDFDQRPSEWENASRSLHMLDGVVPYFLTSGNHDYTSATRNTMINGYFPVSGFAGQPWFGGTFQPDRIENSYGIVQVGRASWLVLALEFGPRDEVLAWADTVLAQHADLPAMLVTHAYLFSDGTRYDHVARPDQPWNPHWYADWDASMGRVNDGEEMWQKLASRHDGLKLVLSGHVLPPDAAMNPDVAARLTSTRPSGTVCHQIVANYQTCSAYPCPQTNGGNGYLRILRFDPQSRLVNVRTYSPYLDAFKTDGANQFDLDGH